MKSLLLAGGLLGLTTAPTLAQETAAPVAAPQQGAAPRLNVLLIMADDLNTQAPGFGGGLAKTPHLDELAERSVHFSRAYCQYPVCNPSRNSMLTGLRPDTTRIYGNNANIRSTLPDVVTLPQQFKAHGYFTAEISKIFHVSQWDAPVPTEKSWPQDDARSWDYRFNTKPTNEGASGARLDLPGNPDIENKDPNAAFSGQEVESESENPLVPPPGGLNYRLKARGDDADQDDGAAAREAVRLLEQNRQKPFFISVGFRRPHAAWVAPKEYFDLYPLESLTLPPATSREGVPRAAFNNAVPHYGAKPEDMKHLLQAYLATTSFLDEQVGLVINAVDRLGLARNTIIVFASDHGFQLGEHGVWHKGMLWEESLRTPLLICAPGAGGNGGPVKSPVEFVDIMPTLLDLCGLAAPPALEGVSLRPLLNEPTREWKRPAFSQVTRRVTTGDGFKRVMGRSVATERWRYNEWDEGREGTELYDLQNDPGQTRNLATDPTWSAVRSELQTTLRAMVRPSVLSSAP